MLVNIGKNSVNPSYVEQVRLPYELLLSEPSATHRMVVHMHSGLDVEEVGTKEDLEKAYDELLYYCNNRKARDNAVPNNTSSKDSYMSKFQEGIFDDLELELEQQPRKKKSRKCVLRAQRDDEDDKWDSEMMI